MPLVTGSSGPGLGYRERAARARVQLRQLTDEGLLDRVATDRRFLSGKPPSRG